MHDSMCMVTRTANQGKIEWSGHPSHHGSSLHQIGIFAYACAAVLASTLMSKDFEGLPSPLPSCFFIAANAVRDAHVLHRGMINRRHTSSMHDYQ